MRRYTEIATSARAIVNRSRFSRPAPFLLFRPLWLCTINLHTYVYVCTHSVCMYACHPQLRRKKEKQRNFCKIQDAHAIFTILFCQLFSRHFALAATKPTTAKIGSYFLFFLHSFYRKTTATLPVHRSPRSHLRPCKYSEYRLATNRGNTKNLNLHLYGW